MQRTDTSGSCVELPWSGGVNFVCRFALSEDGRAINDSLAVWTGCQDVQWDLPVPKTAQYMIGMS